jgi:isoleucyl-tRNA synthetase
MFPPVDKKSFPLRELDVLAFWREHDTYHKSLAARADAPPFVFYEGPPTANGMPHPGHCLTRAVKDLFPRYKTMRGYRCERKAGWDTHGLPVETEVAKDLTRELGRPVHSKEDIEAYGIEKFIHRCQGSVWRYMQEWRNLTERIGFWVDLENAYVTYHQSYVESVWWSLKQLFERGLLYKGHKIVWWWAQGGTALSAGEVGQGYRQVADPSVYVKFPLQEEQGGDYQEYLLVWTTTPWTLPSNQFVAINPNIEYVTLINDDAKELLYVASELADSIIAKSKENWRKGPVTHLANVRYRPPFSCFEHLHGLEAPRSAAHGGGRQSLAWRVINGEFVTTDSGTGLVHIAPAFGEDDYRMLEYQQMEFADGDGPRLINCVAPDGKFTSEAPDFLRGRWVKDCDKDIIRDLKTRGLLFHQEQYLHDYPFCWRAEEDPLIQYPRESWFIRTTAFRDAMLENNAHINWMPEHIKDGRFGKFLESNVDWALSRERFWGTPLPIWVCSETGKMDAVASYDELLAKPGLRGTDVWDAAKKQNPQLADDLKVHKPYIDALTYDSPHAQGARMERVPEVIDCWYDSGAMPFAQWGYQGEPPDNTSYPLPSAGRAGEGGDAGTRSNPLPHPPLMGEGAGELVERDPQKFFTQFPADFISEAIDQTRGWFYSQLAISTMLWGSAPGSAGGSPAANVPYPHPFRNCIVLGLMLGEDGQKMSKSKRNYREPAEIFDRYGADALRWYFFANQPPWTSIRYSEQAIKDSVPEFLLRLWNVYSFFTIYANIDGFDPAEGFRVQSSGFSKDKRSASLDACLFASSPTYRPLPKRTELDRWILSELHRTAARVVERMDQYDNYSACGAITEFVDALSNWYVRRSRDRYWAADKRSADKLDAYWTLYECLVTTAKLIAPFTPFLAEGLWQNLAADEGVFGGRVHESVHFADFPTGDATAIDEQLSERMNLVRHISSLGRQARTAANLKVRQPLARVEVILADATHQAWLEGHCDVIADELNVKNVEFSDQPDKYVSHEVLPNFKLLGPKLGKLLPRVKQWLATQSGAQLLANIRNNGQIDLALDGQQLALTRDEVEVRIQAKPGWAAANDKGVVVVLATELTPELIAEGLARDFVRVVQDLRKDTGCEFTDRIEIGVATDSPALTNTIEQFRDYISAETLAADIAFQALPGVKLTQTSVGGEEAQLSIRIKKAE